MFDAITYALAKAFTKKAIEDVEAGSMRVEDYDSEGNGVVNDSRKLGGNLPSYYASTASIVGKMDKSVYDSNDNGIVDNAEKVNNHTVASDVPADAQFTDTKTLSGLTDTDINNPTEGQALLYNSETEKFENKDISSGGSYITLTTTTEQGENVSMSIGGATYTGTFSSEGICTFKGVKETGTATISTARVTTTLVIEYYGSYVVPVIYIPAHIYGVEWDGTSELWSRTDESAEFTDPNPYYVGMSGTPASPFDDLMPWSGMVEEERTGGTMVKIPKFWYKLTQNGTSLKIQIADKEAEGFSVSPAHMDRGDGKGERDYIYVGRYHCAASDYKSKTGEIPEKNGAMSNCRQNIHALGDNIWQWDFATVLTVRLLYIVEYANWDSQAVIGLGCGDNSSPQNMGYTDSMPYHTGTTQSNRTTYGLGTQYRYIEGLWDNVYDWIDGCYNNSNGLNVILNPSDFSTYNGILLGMPVSGYPESFLVTDVSGAFPVFLPATAITSGSRVWMDAWAVSHTSARNITGGRYVRGRGDSGIFVMQFMGDTPPLTTYNNSIGCRLMELP